MSVQLEEDLPAALTCLKDVDTLLRCPVCFDFLNISMMTKCSHNFCSLCIRKFLCYKLQCPVCNTPATEQDLRNNRLLDDLVVSFKAARQQLSKAHFESPPISPKTPVSAAVSAAASAASCKTPRQRAQRGSSTLSHYFQKKSRTPPAKETGSVSSWIQRGKDQTAAAAAAARLPVAVKEEPVEPMELEEAESQLSVKQEETGSCSISSSRPAASSSPSADLKPVVKVECPVCSVSVSQQFINKHLDTCLSSGEKKESLRSSLGRTRHPMTKLVYNLLSVSELRRRLKESHLSTSGTRDQLVKRHQEFVHIYNAQCDALSPRPAEDIAKEVEANEKARGQLQGKTRPVMVFTKTQTEKEIDEMHSNYRKQHSSDFSRLIAQVKGRLQTSRQTRNVKQEVDADQTPSADPAAEPKPVSVVKTEDGSSDEEPLTRGMKLSSPSPTFSDVSISSSISDIFGPEPVRNHETAVQMTPAVQTTAAVQMMAAVQTTTAVQTTVQMTTAVHTAASGSRDAVASWPPCPGKRKRKT